MPFSPSLIITCRKLAAVILASGLTAAIAAPAFAARIDVRTLTCHQAQSLVQSRGQVVFTLTNTTYDRVVANRSFCKPHERIERKYAQTLDFQRCQIGYECSTRDPLFD